MDTFLGGAAVVVGFIGYVPYFTTILSGKTKPHAFTWFVWGLLTAIAFGGQIVGGGGAGTWVTGFTAIISFVIFGLALFRGKRDFPLADWLCLSGCLLALLVWFLTDSPLGAIVLITLIDLLAFVPTFRKTYRSPESEPAATYVLSAIKFVFGIAALQSFSVLTVLYPASLVLTNGLFVVMLLVRRSN